MTWRQFFVHMAIVVLGLLIAIALEQSVEWLHHRQEREELIANNREECRRNAETTANFISYVEQEGALADRWAALLEAAPAQNGWVKVPVPAAFREQEKQATAGFARIGHVLPELGVLTTARQSQLLQYLPTETAQYFSWAEGVDEWAQYHARSLTEVKAEYGAAMPGTLMLTILPTANTVTLSPSTRDRAVVALRNWQAKSAFVTFHYGRLNRYFNATADGAASEADYLRWTQQHAAH